MFDSFRKFNDKHYDQPLLLAILVPLVLLLVGAVFLAVQASEDFSYRCEAVGGTVHTDSEYVYGLNPVNGKMEYHYDFTTTCQDSQGNVIDLG